MTIPRGFCLNVRYESFIISTITLFISIFFVLNTIVTSAYNYFYNENINEGPKDVGDDCLSIASNIIIYLSLPYYLTFIGQCLLIVSSIYLQCGIVFKKLNMFSWWSFNMYFVIIYYISKGILIIITIIQKDVDCEADEIAILILTGVMFYGLLIYVVYVVHVYEKELQIQSIVNQFLLPNVEAVVNDISRETRIYNHAGGVIMNNDPDRIIYTVQAPPSYEQHMASILADNRNNNNLQINGDLTSTTNLMQSQS